MSRAYLRVFGWLLLLLTLAAGAASPSNRVVVIPVADMHSAPSEDTDVVSQGILGVTVTVLEEKQGWAKVQTTDQYTGWMPLAATRPLAQSDRPYGAHGKVVMVESLLANLYREPDVTAHQPAMTLPFESHLEVFREPKDEEPWLQVRLPDQRLLWIQRGDVISDLRPLTISESIELGKRFLGLPYHWGGTSSLGYDCSGFMQMLVRRRGIIMPRDADLQAGWGGVTAVERQHLIPGDLLYFGSAADKISHTGMYIGNGEFIHATTRDHPVIQISRLDDQPWTKILVACRRVK